MSVDANLDCALAPRAIAIVGASEHPDKIGGRCLEYLARFGFQGAVYPINPSRDRTQGIATYASIGAVPAPIDLIIIAVPGEHAVQAVEEAAAHGVRVAVILAAGFGETGAAGRAQEERMRAAARRTGMRIIGPNAQGLANFKNGAFATHATIFIETTPEDGPVAIVSQSGGGATVAHCLLRERGIGVRYCNAIGNQIDVTVAELALAVARDPEIRLLMLYLEGVPDPLNLARLGSLARERDLPVLVLKAGRTPAGQATSLSHTGAIATEDRVVDAFFEYHGLMRVDDFGDMVRAAELYLKGWRAGGRRLVAISNSGTACVLTADAAAAAGLVIEPLLETTRAALGKVLPAYASTANPVDLTAALMSNSRLFGDTLPIIAHDPGADVFLISIPVAGRGYDVDAFARDAAAFAQTTGKPVVVVAPQPQVAARFKAAGLPVFSLEGEAVAALAQFLSWQERLHIARVARAVLAPWEAAPTGPAQVLNEAMSLALLGKYGVPVTEYRLCKSETEIVDALGAFGGSAAVKGCSSAVTHKSDLGLVHLSVAGAAAGRAAWRAITAAAARHDVALEGVLVAPMVRGRREMMLGAHRDPTFGAVLTVGDGGTYVEHLPDTQVVMAGATRAELRRAIGRLRVARVLGGVRGEPPMDIESLCDALLALGRLILAPDERIDSVDLNPVMLFDAGRGCCAVDAVVVRHAQPSTGARGVSSVR